ncbi:MAG TPA: hypothetical protein VFT22_06290 [Kofleriaceae bacterium]|nr:hypothetical protein [Kofleriaceae bacterium]
MIRPATLGLLAALTLAVPAGASAAPRERDVAAQVVPAPSSPVAAPAGDASSYARREQNDRQVASYEGGSVVVIGISGGALIVLLLILLLI